MWMSPGRVLLKEADMQRRRCEDRVDCSDVATAWTTRHQEQEEAGRSLPWSLLRTCSPAGACLRLLASRTGRIKVCSSRPACGFVATAVTGTNSITSSIPSL